MINIAESLTFTVPLSWEAHSLAQQCQEGQASRQKAKRIYLNTLAVYAVNHYLRSLGFETDFEGSESRNAIALKFAAVADLVIKDIGTVECCPVLPEMQMIQIPPEVQFDRIGYVAVQLSQSLKQADILGFTIKPTPEIALSQLEPLTAFLTHLHQLQSQPHSTAQHSDNGSPSPLSQWLKGACTKGWQTLEVLLGPRTALVAVRNQATGVQRAKLLDLGLQLGEQAVLLILTLSEDSGQGVNALVQVHPAEGEPYLPAQLKLIMLSESGEMLQEARARHQDNYIQLMEFSGQIGDRFRLQVALNDVSITETFVF